MPLVHILKKKQEAEQAKAKEALAVAKESEQQAQRQQEAKVRKGRQEEQSWKSCTIYLYFTNLRFVSFEISFAVKNVMDKRETIRDVGHSTEFVCFPLTSSPWPLYLQNVMSTQQESGALNTTYTSTTKNSGGPLNTTYTKPVAESKVNSYEMTPLQPTRASNSLNNYNIDEMQSDDSTDDENSPKKKIPQWAMSECLLCWW